MIQRSQAMSDTRLAAALQARKVATRSEFTWRWATNFTGTIILPIVSPIVLTVRRAWNLAAISFHLGLPSGTALQVPAWEPWGCSLRPCGVGGVSLTLIR